MSGLADCWAPVPLRWRHVQPGDVIVASSGEPWSVQAVGNIGLGLHVEITRAALPWRGTVDPDEVATVLVPVPERDALTCTRDELGARITERRAA